MSDISVAKMCGVYLLKDGSTLVWGIDYEPTGPGGLSSNLVVRLSPEAAPLMLGIVALRMLDATRRVDAREWEGKDVLRGGLAIAGARSHRALESGARYALLLRRDSEIRVTPTAARPSNGGGYEHLAHLTTRTCAPGEVALRDLIAWALSLEID